MLWSREKPRKAVTRLEDRRVSFSLSADALRFIFLTPSTGRKRMTSADTHGGADLILPTPGVTSIPPRQGCSNGSLPAARFGESGETSADAQKASAAFHFPYPEAYPIQIDLMRSVFRAIEERKVGVFESPTGTVS